MTTMLWAIVASVAILFILVNLQGALVPRYQGLKWGLGGRDAPVDKPALQGRADRTVSNHIESMLMFIPLAFIAHLLGLDGKLISWGAGLYVIGRIGFIPAYLGAWYGVRSLFWFIGVVGTVFIFVKIVMGA